MLDKMLADVANEVLENLPDLLDDQPITVTAKCRKRSVQVVVTVSTYTPMKLDQATLNRIRMEQAWPQEVVNLAHTNAAAS